MFKSLVFAASVVACSTTFAQYKTTELRDDLSKSTKPGADYTFGLGFVRGTIEGADMDSPGLYCIPGSVTLGQVGAVVLKYINDTPKDWDKPATYNILVAVIFTWPCKNKSSTPPPAQKKLGKAT